MAKRALLLVVVLSAASAAWGQMTFKPGEGWQGVRPKEAGPEFRTDRSDFEQALAVYQTGDVKTSMAMCDEVVGTYKTGPWVERAMLLKARAYFRLNDLNRAEQALDALKKRFPGTALGAQISDLQMAIASAHIEGKRSRGVKALEDMVETNPYGPRSDEAQFDIGQYCMKNGKYRDAADAFTLVLAHYADSRYREDAMFLRAKALYLDNQGPQRDPLPYEEARQGILDYLREFPNGKNLKEAQALLEKANNALAQKRFLIGEYYRKQGHARAAERYYQSVVMTYPKSPWAKMARGKLPVDWMPPEEKTAPEEKPAPEQKPETPANPPDQAKPDVETAPEPEPKSDGDAPGEKAPGETARPAEGDKLEAK